MDFILIIMNCIKQGSIMVRFMFRERLLWLICRDCFGREQVQSREINQEAVAENQAIDGDNIDHSGSSREYEIYFED